MSAAKDTRCGLSVSCSDNQFANIHHISSLISSLTASHSITHVHTYQPPRTCAQCQQRKTRVVVYRLVVRTTNLQIFITYHHSYHHSQHPIASHMYTHTSHHERAHNISSER